MKNLIKMDFDVYKSSLGFIFLYAILFPSLFGAFAAIGTIAFLCIYMLINSIVSTEEKDQIRLLHKSLPVTEKEIVGVKYAEVVIIWLVSAALGILGVILIGYIKQTMGKEFDQMPLTRESFLMISVLFCMSMIMVSIIIPVVYKVGVGKGRFILNLIWFIAAFSIPSVVERFDWQGSGIGGGAFYICMFAVCAAAVTASFLVTVKIYREK